MVYIIVDIYALPIDHFLLSYSTLCLSYNLSQVEEYNTCLDCFARYLRTVEYIMMLWYNNPLEYTISIQFCSTLTLL